MGDFGRDKRDNSQTRRIAELATRQHGVVAFRQLEVSRQVAHQWVKLGRLHRVHRGVYIVGTRRLSAKGRWLAAVLAEGEHAVLSHRAAIVLHGLRPRRPGPVDVTVVSRGRRHREGIRVHSVRTPPPSTTVDGIPVTTVARALLDFAATASSSEVRLAIEAAERREIFDLREIEALDAHGHHGQRALQQAIAEAAGEAPATRSEFESEFLVFLRARHLPEPHCNVLVHGELVDFWWPEHRLVVETDGYAWHRGRRAFENDRRRDAVFTVAGIRSLRLTQRRLRHDATATEHDLRVLLDLL